ncbi:MAG: hypothetical protein ACOCZ5_00350 [bacterium]
MEKLVLTNNSVATIRKNLIDGITIASGSKSSATYYHSRDEQTKAIQNQVKKLYTVSKELPLIIAAQKGVTGAFASEVLLNEFRNTLRGGACNIVNPIDWYDNGLSDKAVLSVLSNLGESGIPYVLRMFVELKNSKVNNERTRKIILGYIWGQNNLEFYSMKYRNKIAEVLKHVYGRRKTSILISIAQKQARLNGLITTEKERNILNNSISKYFNGDVNTALKLFLFIMKADAGVDFSSFELLSEYMKAKTDITKAKKVPEEVLLGLISNKTHPQYNLMWSTEAKRKDTMTLIRKNVVVTSVNQQVRQTKSTAKLGVEKVVDMTKATDFLALYKTGYEYGFTADMKKAIDILAEKKKIKGFFYNNIGVVLDKSQSMTGHKQESKNTPKAIAHFTSLVLKKSAQNSYVSTTDGFSTDLASAFINLLKNEDPVNPYDAFFIITDGYENSYDGLLNEVISLFKAETGRDVPVFQISPITGAEMEGDVRNLGKDIVKMAINNPVAIQTQINARLLEIDTKSWLETQVQALSALPITRNKKIANE